MSDQHPERLQDRPPPPAYLSFYDAIGFAAQHLDVSIERAYLTMLDALCDGALSAEGHRGGGNFAIVSPANWVMRKYEGADLYYDVIEIKTVDFLTWISPKFASQLANTGEGSAVIDGELNKALQTELRCEGPRKGRGRPSLCSVFNAEILRRLEEDDPPVTLAALCGDLLAWGRGALSGQRLPGARTLEAHIRENFAAKLAAINSAGK